MDESITRISEGVAVRTYPSGKSRYQITFTLYKGGEAFTCKEILRDVPVTQSNNKIAKARKGEIDMKIQRGTFRYLDEFPQSKRALLLSPSKALATIGDSLDEYLQDVQNSHPHSTHGAYKRSVRLLKREIGTLTLLQAATDPDPIKQMIRKWGQTKTLKTIRNALIPLRAICDIALIEGTITRNPLDVIKVKRLVSAPKQSSPAPDPYSLDEILTLLPFLFTMDRQWGLYFQFAFWTGMRTSELYGLKRTDFDWINNQVFVQRAVVERVEKSVKTPASLGAVQLTVMAKEAAKLLIAAGENTGCEYLFINPVTGQRILDYEETNKPLMAACRASGVRYRPQMHTRHSFASNMLSDGENIYEVAHMLRHKNIEMVMKVYGRWIENGRRTAAPGRYRSLHVDCTKPRLVVVRA